MKKIVTAIIATILSAGANAADTYGYLAMWQNPQDGNDALLIKTTKENMDTLSGVQNGEATGCKSVVPLHNTCIAVAYPKSEGRLTTNNAVVITSPRFKSVHQVALNQCIKKYGSQGQCGLETVYCTSSAYYGGTVKTLLNRLKSQ